MEIGNAGNAATVYGHVRPHQPSPMVHRRTVKLKVHVRRPLSVFIRCVHPINYDTQTHPLCQAAIRAFSRPLRPAPGVVS